ncbi:MAG: hypothetical protein WAS54_09370 [Scrofimicrobium sp.]
MPEWLGAILLIGGIFLGVYLWETFREKISDRADSDRKKRLGETDDPVDRSE